MKAIYRTDRIATVIYYEQEKPDSETGVWEGSISDDPELCGYLFVQQDADSQGTGLETQGSPSKAPVSFLK